MKRTNNEREILIEYFDGVPVKEIATKFRISTKTVGEIRRRHGIPPRGRAGKLNYRWAGGRCVHPSGYVYVWVPESDEIGTQMLTRGRHLREHRLVMAHSLGRPLTQSETVHHLNGNRSDNRIENLQLRNKAHGAGQSLRCRTCGSTDLESISI